MSMHFRRRKPEEPEINLIPFIDVLLVILIFLMLSTTYSRFTQLQVTLPLADTQALHEQPREVVVAVSADGGYGVNGKALPERDVDTLAAELGAAANGSADAVLVISADAQAAHQAVVGVMDAARRVGLQHLTFVTQTSDGKAAR